MSAERDLAEAIYHAFTDMRATDEAMSLWRDMPHLHPRERFDALLPLLARYVIDRVLARRQREAARTGPWEGSQRGCVCPPTSEQTCKGPLCPRRGIGAAGFIGAARTGPWGEP